MMARFTVPLIVLLRCILMLRRVFARSNLLAPCSTQVHHGWKACRLYHHHHHDDDRHMVASSSHHYDDDDKTKKKKRKKNVTAAIIMEQQYQHGCPPDAILLNVRSLPTTALSVLLENAQIPEVQHIRLDNLYYSTNLALPPDISTVGRDFYTLYYQLDIPPAPPPPSFMSSSNNEDDYDNDDNVGLISYCRHGGEHDDDDAIPHVRATRRTLRFAGINYRATAWLNGTPLAELHDNNEVEFEGDDVPESSSPAGMFRRRSYDVTNGGRFVLRIDPPDHPGTGNCTSSTTTDSSSCGQGGNHEAAKDGTTPQFMLGWDWW
jgi:hypothetical protein